MTNAARPRVLFLAPVEPWCRENGSSVIIADLLEGLATVDQADQLSVFLRRPPPGYAPRPPAGFHGVTLGLHGLPRWASIVGAVARGSSPMRMRFANGRVARDVLDTVRRRGFSPTVIHVEHLPLVDIGLTIARTFHCPLVYRAHNIESLLMGRRLGLPGALGSFLFRTMDRAEAKAIEACQLTLCISDADLAWVRSNAPGARAELFPCSLLLSRYDHLASGQARTGPQIAFVGGLDWPPNEAGLRWFVVEVLPHILRAVPEARLAVLARGATTRPWVSENRAVEILPPEADAPSLFAASRVSVAPLLQGGGVRIKIPESLAVGCPVVATPIGGEGLDLPGLTTTAEPVAFADACVRHLVAGAGDHTARAQRRAAVEAKHGAGVLARKLVALWVGLNRAA